jgi:G3E family GTPase
MTWKSANAASAQTTLINYVLKAFHGKKVAVIENEFGEVAVDNDLIVDAGQEIFETQNGWLVYHKVALIMNYTLTAVSKTAFVFSICCRVG